MRLLWPGTETPRSAGTSRTPPAERTVMSAMARPAFGLTSSITESWVASAPTAVNHWSGTGRRAVDGGERGRLRAAGDQAGRQVVGAGDHRRAEPLGRGGDPAGAHRQRRGRGAEPDLDVARHLGGRVVRADDADTEQVGPDAGQRVGADHGRGGERGLDRRPSVPLIAVGVQDQQRQHAGHGQHDGEDHVGPETGASSRTAFALALGRGRAQHQHDQDREPPAGPAARPAATSAARRGRSAESGRSTCQARVLRSSALACSSPAVASSAAATSPSAGAGSTTYSMPREASASTASGVGRAASPCTSVVKSRSSGGQVEHLVLAGGDAVVAAHGVGQPVAPGSRGPRGSRARGRAPSSAPCRPGCRRRGRR